MFERRPLASLIEHQVGGGTPSRADRSFWGGNIPWASVKDFTDGSLELKDTEERITEAGLRTSTANLIPAGIPIVCTRMAVGRAAAATMPVAINQDVRALFPKPNVNPRYLLRLLARLQAQAEGQSIGSTVKGIRTADYLALIVPIAPEEEQPKIVQILDTLDTQIRQTEALITKLERIKQGLLTDLLTRGIDQNGQLRPTPEQAPHLYKDSPLGRIPREWNITAVGHCLTSIEAGKSPDCPDVPAQGNEWGVLKVGAVHPNGFREHENKVVLDSCLRNPSYLVAAGDLLMSRANTFELVGLVCHILKQPKNLMLSDKTLRLNFDSNEMTTRFAFWQLQMNHIRRQIEVAATGTSGSMKNISQGAIERLTVVQPSLAEQKQITARVDSLVARTDAERANLSSLQAIKVGAMDDLLTGRVRVTPLLESAKQAHG